jgi:hypothetical protein
MPCSTGPCLPAKVAFRTTTCLVAVDPAFQIRRAPTPPRVPWLQIQVPYKGGLWCIMCPTSPDPASLQGRAPVRHMSCSFGSCLPVREGSDAHVYYSSGSYLPAGDGFGAPHVIRLQILPPYREGSGATTAWYAVSYGPWASNIKKSLGGLHVHVDPRVPNTACMFPRCLTLGPS